MIQSCAVSPPGREGDTSPATVRDVLLLLLAADKYPILGNHDWTVSALLEKEALALAETAVPSSSDPPEFAAWLTTLRRQPLPSPVRAEVYDAIRDYFEPEAC